MALHIFILAPSLVAIVLTLFLEREKRRDPVSMEMRQHPGYREGNPFFGWFCVFSFFGVLTEAVFHG